MDGMAGNLIEIGRSSAGYVQSDLAAEIDVSERTIRGWEKGRIPDQWVSLARLCQALNISADHLLAVDNKKEPPGFREFLTIFEQLSIFRRRELTSLAYSLLEQEQEEQEQLEDLEHFDELTARLTTEMGIPRPMVDALIAMLAAALNGNSGRVIGSTKEVDQRFD